jgi:RNA polymerase sigma factor (sigma-70 family)
VPFDPATFFLRDPGPLPDEELEIHERLARVRAGLNELSPRTREIFLMHRLDGLKYLEIADMLSISVSAVEKHVARAMKFLAEWTQGY